ncbi:MAG: hypothetical protein CLLPBCKN_001393 [Chroococcidiopsis cubana SAG 39.79]|uniref:Uncharacterized protein n=1 Tax=Chroococcidiopsis cubana SAG 39.79 TaxID=388085 RepID=A0AB37UE46_9CYAN|nr:hypothetical protein [Chroococcidiopsis cubana]MDZ4872005.1 hypothetical protein [Chroococcidiopsis cubana SAG 39.79]RUT06335.1 hypothetical protein DSM107010_52800 [Chroococcidiopsis cubana SAG 39.79]
MIKHKKVNKIGLNKVWKSGVGSRESGVENNFSASASSTLFSALSPYRPLLTGIIGSLLTILSGCAFQSPEVVINNTKTVEDITQTATSTTAAIPRTVKTTPVDRQVLQQLEGRLYQQLQVLMAKAQGARPDGYVYTVDLSQILYYAAGKKDSRLYLPLRDFATRNLIIDKKSDPYTKGFVLWRYRDGAPADASGTTEALRLAESLWLGSQTLGDETDRQLAMSILQGYTRHAQIDHDKWLIRNYFNLQTRAFANNSFLVGYDPDLLKIVAQVTGDRELKSVAQKSYATIREAATPSGLLYDIIQPEVLTLVPELKQLAIFSPNDVVKLANTCTVAERAVEEAPEVGQRVIRFALARMPNLNTYYYGRNGEPVIPQKAEIPTYACLVRLSAKLKEEKAMYAFLNPFVNHVEFMAQNINQFSLYTVGEALLALQSVSQFNPPGSRDRLQSSSVSMRGRV